VVSVAAAGRQVTSFLSLGPRASNQASEKSASLYELWESIAMKNFLSIAAAGVALVIGISLAGAAEFQRAQRRPRQQNQQSKS